MLLTSLTAYSEQDIHIIIKTNKVVTMVQRQHNCRVSLMNLTKITFSFTIASIIMLHVGYGRRTSTIVLTAFNNPSPAGNKSVATKQCFRLYAHVTPCLTSWWRISVNKEISKLSSRFLVTSLHSHIEIKTFISVQQKATLPEQRK